ncbi:MAG TPA: hypothetical protein VN812_14185 [Candidatus Acidoferrales bacterium]|nr:hypothetical protein [Candidatus Acidoferrales bacterium]
MIDNELAHGQHRSFLLIDDGFDDSALSARHKAVIRYADVYPT